MYTFLFTDGILILPFILSTYNRVSLFSFLKTYINNILQIIFNLYILIKLFKGPGTSIILYA